MKTITQDLKDSAASVLNDPFKKGCMVKFSTYCSKDVFTGGWNYRGTVGFENGKTEGEQKFEASSLKELLTKMQAFVETLEGN